MTGEGNRRDVQEPEGGRGADGLRQPGPSLAAETLPFTIQRESATIYLGVCRGIFIFQ